MRMRPEAFRDTLFLPSFVRELKVNRRFLVECGDGNHRSLLTKWKSDRLSRHLRTQSRRNLMKRRLVAAGLVLLFPLGMAACLRIPVQGRCLQRNQQRPR